MFRLVVLLDKLRCSCRVTSFTSFYYVDFFRQNLVNVIFLSMGHISITCCLSFRQLQNHYAAPLCTRELSFPRSKVIIRHSNALLRSRNKLITKQPSSSLSNTCSLTYSETDRTVSCAANVMPAGMYCQCDVNVEFMILSTFR